MPFNLFENSIFGGRPYELYEFRCGIRVWRYTSAAKPIIYAGNEFTPLSGLKRGPIKQSNTTEKEQVTIEMRGNAPLMQAFVAVPPSEELTLTLLQLHRGDPDTEARVAYIGSFASAAWKADFTVAEMSFTSIDSALAQPGLRRSFQYNCPYTVYSPQCGVDALSFRDIATITEISGRTITVNSISRPDGFFNGGFVSWTTAEGAVERRWVYSQVSTSLILHITTIGLATNMQVELYAGCDHNPDTCYDRFNNWPNYGGMLGLPKINPFTTTVH